MTVLGPHSTHSGSFSCLRGIVRCSPTSLPPSMVPLEDSAMDLRADEAPQLSVHRAFVTFSSASHENVAAVLNLGRVTFRPL